MTTPDDESVDPPHTVTVLPTTYRALHYTDTAQFDYLRREIERFGYRPNVWLNEDTNEITWYGGSYRLPLTFWLVNGSEVYRTEDLHHGFHPAAEWGETEQEYFEQNPTEV